MIRQVVFDTSTLVSAALKRDSVPYRALSHALRFCDLCASRETLEELKTVLMRDKFRRYLARQAREDFVLLIQTNVRLCVVPDAEWPVGIARCRDPKDEKFLALALECEADAVVSSDEDLLVLDPWADVRILRPADFVHALAPTVAGH